MTTDPNYRRFFGDNREKAIQRDGEKCVKCGMTREEHRAKYGRDITVDHIDGNGCSSDDPNNDLDNLQTLCLKCHGTKDIKRRAYTARGETHVRAKLTAMQVINIRHMRGSISHVKIGKLYGISPSKIGEIQLKKRWRTLEEDLMKGAQS